MAMKRKPKPLRPSGPTKPVTKYTMGTPKKPVTMITKVTKPLRKSTVRNPSAPKGSGSGASAGSVKPITKSETFMKKDKARRDRSGIGRPENTKTFLKGTATKKYRQNQGANKMIADTQRLNSRGYTGLSASEKKSLTAKADKPSKVTPKKKTPAAPTAKPKRRIFVGRGMRGGMMGGGGFPNRQIK